MKVLGQGIFWVFKHIDPKQTGGHQARFLFRELDMIELRFGPFTCRSQWLIELKLLSFQTYKITPGVNPKIL